ncbi:type VI secretion system tip protein VgrG [Rhodobacteraceae bacterium]|nr:type VI secretion system tip protein VgrG [Paracoccaceae bacterium]
MAEKRNITAKTPLADEKLLFSTMAGQESISQCFTYQVTLLSEDIEIASSDLLGLGITIKLESDRQERFFHGIVDSFTLTEFGDERVQYVAILRPWLWFLSKTSDSRIFQNMSVVDIVEEVFSAYPNAQFEKRLQETYPAREYCVQYNETDLNFVSRLLEHEGISYFFEYTDGDHTMVLTDANAKFAPAKGYDKIPYREDSDAGRDFDEGITQWQHTDSAVSASYTQTDYDFTKPSADLKVRSETPFGHKLDDGKQYFYPGTYMEIARGETLAGIRLEEIQSAHQQIDAISTAIGPAAGHTFALTDYPRKAENDDYLIQSVRYDLSDGQYRAGGGSGNTGFSAAYSLLPLSIPFRPTRIAPVPVMRGPQTAVVVGPSGEEIYTDEYSRVKVQFHWDRLGENDETTTCFIRVSSVWAGSGWGFIQIPRIGQEVIVDFLEGDPDQPIITGRVYNANQMPPYGLPGSATQSGWKSNSSPGGGGWNEMRFEDKKGSEEVYFQAEKDHNELVKNNETRTIGNDWVEDVGHDGTQSIGNDRTESVGNNKSTKVGVDRSVDIGNNDTETVGTDRSLSVGSNESISVGVDSTETIGSNHTQSVGSNQTLSVGIARTRSVGAAEAVTVGAAQSVNVGAARSIAVAAAQSHAIGASDSWTIGDSQSVTIASGQTVGVGSDQSITVGAAHTLAVSADSATSVGANSTTSVAEDMTVSVGKNLAVNAADQISLVCGSASLTMKKDGTIVLEGKDITVKGSGKINIEASSDVTIKGSKINQN